MGDRVHTSTTGQFEAIREVTETADPTTLEEIRVRLSEMTSQVNTKLRGRVITPDQAGEILGPDRFFGADAVKRNYGVDISEEELARIPFNLTEAEANNAKRLGHMISLHSDKLGNGEPLNMLMLNEYVAKTKKRKLLFSTDWYKEEAFGNETDKLEWRETSVKPVSNTADQNYLTQLELLIAYLRNEVYKDLPLPAHYEEAIREFEQRKSELQKLIANWGQPHPTIRLPNGQPAPNWYVAAEIFESLKINQDIRPTPVSALQDVTTVRSSGVNMLENELTGTSARGSGGRLVDFGGAASDGAHVRSWHPGHRGVDLRALFSRSLSK